MIKKIQKIETLKRFIRIKDRKDWMERLNGKIEKTEKIETLKRFKDQKDSEGYKDWKD